MCPLAEVRGVLGNDRGLGRETRRSPLPSERRRAGAARAERRVRSMRRAAGAAGLRGGRAGRTVVKVPQQPRRVPPPGQGVLHELALGAPLRQVDYIILGGFRGLRHGGQPRRNLAPAMEEQPYYHTRRRGESCSLLHCVEPRGRWRGGGSLQKSLRHTWCLQIERWLLRLAGSSRPGTEDASHCSRMRFLRFWALLWPLELRGAPSKPGI